LLLPKLQQKYPSAQSKDIWEKEAQETGKTAEHANANVSCRQIIPKLGRPMKVLDLKKESRECEGTPTGSLKDLPPVPGRHCLTPASDAVRSSNWPSRWTCGLGSRAGLHCIEKQNTLANRHQSGGSLRGRFRRVSITTVRREEAEFSLSALSHPKFKLQYPKPRILSWGVRKAVHLKS
jgi:hypothetical protein